MKKRLSTYWWCQIIGWSTLYATLLLFYLSMPGSIWNFVLLLFLAAISGMFISHIMRLFIIKTRILQLNILRQIVYMLLTTIFFSFIYTLVVVSFAEVLHWEEGLVKFFSNKGNIILFTFNYCFFLGIWNLIYFLYHYVQKLQQLEGEKIKVEMQREAIELQVKAMVATQEQERKRISRDLHDDVGTKLSALNLFLSSLSEKATVINNDEIKSLACSSKQFIKEAMYDIRQLLFNLSPTILEEFGYTTAVEGLVNKINETKQIHFDLVVFGINHRLKKDYELALYRITQELIIMF